MNASRYSPEVLIAEFHRLMPLLRSEVGEGIGQWLRPRRTVARHGTCGTVLYWSFWDSRQRGLGIDPVYFTYAVSFDPDRFELSRHDWAVVLHLNTVRSYYGPFDLRGFLATRMKPAVPEGFQWQDHPRQFRVIQEIDFKGAPAELNKAVQEPLVRLVTATHPVLEGLFQQLRGTSYDPAQKREFIAARAVPRANAANAARPGAKGSQNRGIGARLREAVVKRHGMMCHLCGAPIEEAADLHIDHLVPWAQGGLTELENLRPSHYRCNLRKGAGGKVIPAEQRSPAKFRPNWRRIPAR